MERLATFPMPLPGSSPWRASSPQFLRAPAASPHLPDVAKALAAASSLRTLGGARVEFAASSDVVVVNFWASWCKPCKRELPFLDRLHRRLGQNGVKILAISIDQDATRARRFSRDLGLGLPLLHDGPGGLATQLDIPSLPCTYVLDRSGRTVHTGTGSSDEELQKLSAVVERLVRTGGAS